MSKPSKHPVHKSLQPPRQPIILQEYQTKQAEPETTTNEDPSITIHALGGMSQRSLQTTSTNNKKDMDGSFASILDEPEDATYLFNNSFSRFVRGILREKHVEERLVRQKFVMKHQDSLRLIRVEKHHDQENNTRINDFDTQP